MIFYYHKVVLRATFFDLICTVYCLITKFLPKRKSEKLLEVLPMVGHFKHLYDSHKNEYR